MGYMRTKDDFKKERSMSVNKIILLGKLGKDPELKDAGNSTMCKMTVATNENWMDKSGQKQERTEWHNVVTWGATAENCAKYLSKGRDVYIEGKIQTRSYDKDGEKRYITEVNAQSVQFIGKQEKKNDLDVTNESIPF